MSTALRVRVDADVCVGSTWCTTVAPEVFRMGADGRAQVVDAGAGTPEDVEEAADSCPVSAISVVTG